MSSSSAIPSTPAQRSTSWLRSGTAIAALLAGIKFALQIAAAPHYGIFRDEMYYLACGRHLTWGYVDHPPLMPFIAWLVEHTLGESLLAVRLLPALAGAALVFLAGSMARHMGGGRMAQALAALAVLTAPIYMLMQHWFTMNAFEPLLWMACAWCVLRYIEDQDPHWWLGIGILCGVGLELKYTIVLFAAGLLLGLALTPHRRVFRSRWFWMGCLAAILIFLPHFVWLVRHHFPFLEYEHNVRMTARDIRRGPISFLVDQAMILNPVSALLWVLGVLWLLFTRAGARYRILAWTFLAVVGALLVLQGKNYYVSPVYPMMFAAGAVALTQWVRSAWLRGGYAAILAVTGALLAPLTIPLLPVRAYLRYQQAIGLAPLKAENQPTGPLPQFFADEFGWEDMVRKTAAVYWSLPPAERARTAIFANNWGEASAVDYFGPRYGLPPAICPHNSYWFWGPHNYDGSTMIVLGSDGSGDRRHFQTVIAAGQVDNPWSRLDERYTIWLCRGLHWDLRTIWPKLKKWG
ncbi:MAG: glycosyltransferase family 39 protein [Acidobacteriaceae bacterium]